MFKKKGVTNLKSFPVERGNIFNKFSAWLNHKSLKRKGYVRVSWVDPSKLAHHYLGQTDGQKVEIKGIGASNSLVFSLNDNFRVFDHNLYAWYWFSNNDPVAINMNPQDEASRTPLTSNVITNFIRSERLEAQSLMSPFASARTFALSAGVIIGLAIAGVIVNSMIQGWVKP